MTEAQPMVATLICFIGMVLLMLMIIMAGAIRIVPEHRKLLVYRLGRELGELGPGLVFLIPFIDRGVMVDTRDQAARAQAAQERYGALGETRTHVDQDGTVEFDGRTWSAVSREPLPPGTCVRVTRVILEVERV